MHELYEYLENFNINISLIFIKLRFIICVQYFIIDESFELSSLTDSESDD